jgi:monoamine oxidase
MHSISVYRAGPSRRDVMKGAAALAATTGLAIRQAGADPAKPHVVILGAGLAGLCAAYNLQQKGWSYTILEADKDRVGGRVRTVHFSDGLHSELGAMRIPDQHKVTMNYVTQFGLKYRKFVMGTKDTNPFYFARGKVVPEDKPLELAALYDLLPSERGKTPDDLWEDTVLKTLKGLTVAEKDDLATSDVFTTDTIKNLDRLSLRRLIEQSGLSDEAIEYLLVGYADATLQHTAATEHLREEMSEIWSNANFHELVDGTEALPCAFLDRLTTKPRMGCEVVRIEHGPGDGKATVTFRSGTAFDRITGDFVLCTIPLPVLGRLDVPFAGTKMRAIRQTWYESATKVLVPTTTRFWETAAKPIYGGATYTDLMIGSIYYPNDNAENPDPAKSKGPGVLIASYCWGQDARRLGAMSDDDRAHFTVAQASKIHPELSQPGIVRWDEVKSVSWDAQPWAGGAFAFYMPGQFQSLHQAVISPEKRVYFAGEHCSHTHTWMQGALESAESAVAAMQRVPGYP